MTRARDVSRLITTPPSIYATDTETSSAGYLTNASASSTYLTQANHEPSFRNYIINGAFNIWQRGTSFTDATLGTSSTLSYCADRWQGYRNNASGGITVTRQSSGLTGFQYSLRLQRDSGGTKSNQMFILQMIETVNSIPLAGKTVTLSFYAKAGANFSATSNVLTANVLTGTGTDQSAFSNGENLPSVPNLTGGTIAINQNFNITTSWVRYSVTGTLASNITQAAARLYYTPSGTAGAADFVEITGVQLEIEPIASPYEFKPINHELAQCQRYYQKSFPLEVTPASSYTSTKLELQGARHQVADVVGFRSQTLFFPQMRVTPTLTFYNGSINSTTTLRLFSNNNQTQDLSGHGAYAPDTKSFYISYYTGVTVGTSGLSCMVFFNYTASSEL